MSNSNFYQLRLLHFWYLRGVKGCSSLLSSLFQHYVQLLKIEKAVPWNQGTIAFISYCIFPVINLLLPLPKSPLIFFNPLFKLLLFDPLLQSYTTWFLFMLYKWVFAYSVHLRIFIQRNLKTMKIWRVPETWVKTVWRRYKSYLFTMAFDIGKCNTLSFVASLMYAS